MDDRAQSMTVATLDRLRTTQRDLREEYLAATTDPWIIGDSGGKDSTLLAQLDYKMRPDLARSDRNRPVHLLCNDTLVDSPVLMAYIDRMHSADVSLNPSRITQSFSVRRNSSTNRALTANMRRNGDGFRLNSHDDMKGCMGFRPLLEMTTDDVLLQLLQKTSPWGGIYSELVTLYRTAHGGECQLVMDKSAAPCAAPRHCGSAAGPAPWSRNTAALRR
jgi:DNA sulfur modification protein DndC